MAHRTLLSMLVVVLSLLAGGVQPPRGPEAARPAEPPEEIGSLRNARAAFEIPAGTAPADRPVLTFLAGGISDEQRRELEALAPNVRVVPVTRESALQHAAGAHAIDAHLLTPEFLARAKNLVWVQSRSAGVDRYVSMPGLADTDRIVLTNMRAAHGPAIADHAFAMLLTLTRGMSFHARNQAAGRWSEGEAPVAPLALQGRTMLVVGIGGIGTEIARRAHGFGMRVIATRRSDAPAPDYVERVGKPADLLAMLPEADVVAVCVPLTPETDGLFGEEALGAMKPGAYLINIARGRIVKTEALIAALDSGRLAGACLDVTEPEPLPEGHRLWSMPNVVITPHCAADAPLTRERVWALQQENFRRFGAGEPLLNVVDKRAGY